MTLDGPTIFAAAAAANFAWAHYFSEVLPISTNGPTAFIADPAANFAWAHYFSERCCQYPRMGPLHLYQMLLLPSPGPIISLRSAADFARWAHRICSFYC